MLDRERAAGGPDERARAGSKKPVGHRTSAGTRATHAGATFTGDRGRSAGGDEAGAAALEQEDGPDQLGERRPPAGARRSPAESSPLVGTPNAPEPKIIFTPSRPA